MKTKEKYSLNMHLARFGTDQACHDYLIQVRWNGKSECPKCGNNHMNYYLSTRRVYKCSNCYKQFSATQGTIFHRSKVPLSKWFTAIYLFTINKRGISSCQLAKSLGVKQHTAWYMLHRLREAMKHENEIVLSGVVEADETFVAPKISRDKRLQAAQIAHNAEQDKIHGLPRARRLQMGIKFKRGRKKGSTKEVLKQKELEREGKPYNSHASEREPFEKGAVILGMVERQGRLVLKKLGRNTKSVTQARVLPILKRHISASATFITDDASVYNNACTLFAEHKTVNHEVGYCVDEIHSNTIENVWKHLKKMIDGTYFHISYFHFNAYLHETSYRWNRRKESELFLFEDLVPLLTTNRLSYEKLKGRNLARIAA